MSRDRVPFEDRFHNYIPLTPLRSLSKLWFLSLEPSTPPQTGTTERRLNLVLAQGFLKGLNFVFGEAGTFLHFGSDLEMVCGKLNVLT